MRPTLRLRLVLTSVGVVALALVAAAAVLLLALQAAVTGQLRDRAQAAASEVAAMVDTGRTPDPLPVTGAQIVQVVTASGTVRAASPNADRLVPLLSPDEVRTAAAGAPVEVPGSRAGLAGELLVAARPAGPRQEGTVVLAGVSTQGARDGLVWMRTALLLGLPVLPAGLALLLLVVIGSALAPVENLRRAAARITGQSTDERLPVPPGQDEIARLATTLNDMLDRLAAARRSQEMFVADAAHELRSPLAVLRTTAEVAARVDQDPSAAELLGQIERLCELAEDLLLLARATNTPPPAPGPVDLADLARQVAGRYPQARVPVHVDGRGTAVAHRPDLERALVNLCDNAVRHAATGVHVQVGPGTVLVGDDGPGIPEADRERVFDRFTRLQSARERDSGGTGLGLAIVRALITRNAGTITLDTGPGGGLAARIRLPVRAPG